jgi:hypothetical protein
MTVLPRSIFATMRSPCLRRAACVVAIVATACSKSPGHQQSDPPPPAEFLLSSADSTFWVATTKGETHVRGAPLVLANYDGRFYELYSADDDYSFPDASLVGERLYRRDLLTGDSALVFADTVVPRFAREYALSHPGERPLSPDEEGSANPATNVTAEVDVLEVYGPYVSFEYHVDVERPDRPLWHATRRGVINLRTGRAQTVADVFGGSQGERLVAASRRAFQHTRDSLRAARAGMTDDERRAADALGLLEFDDRSFNLTELDGAPALQFSIPGRGEGAIGNAVELEAVAADSASWWRSVVPGLPSEDDGGNDRWTAEHYRVVARYDTSGDIAHISIADSATREWPVTSVLAPVHRIDWLDHPPIGDDQRRALARAFDQAAAYDHATRVAAAPFVGRILRSASLPIRLGLRSASDVGTSAFYLVTSHASLQGGARKPARNIRADDATARQQHGKRVRRRDSLDDRQVRGDRRISSQPRGRRDRFDRSRRFSRADSARRLGGDESERELRRDELDGSRRACGGGGLADRSTPAHKLVLFDVRCR